MKAYPKDLLLEVFRRFRHAEGHLGMGELLAAYQAVDGGWGGEDRGALRDLARLLWCKSPVEMAELDEIFDAVLAASPRQAPESAPDEPSAGPSPVATRPEERPAEPLPSSPPTQPPERKPALSVLPVRTPAKPAASEARAELRAYWPVSRRSMVYTWRYLRRPVKDGPPVVLNVPATVERTARQGFFLQPVYDRRESNHAHLVLLADQGGSMVPFHRFTRDLVETATTESTLHQVDVWYFHNVPLERVFRDPYRTESLPLSEALGGCSPDSSLLVVSDAGAARGYRSLQRIRASADGLVAIKRLTTLIAWLNPMPEHRWAGTSAQFIARLVPMFQMDPEGFSHAVDVLRGQPPHPSR